VRIAHRPRLDECRTSAKVAAMTRVMILLTMLGAIEAGAQVVPRSACPMVNGIAASVSTTDSSAGARANSVGYPVDGRSAIDTTWTFDIRERTWTRPLFAASVGLGLTGGSAANAASGTTTAPDSAAARSWNVCAAASVGMRNPTLTLRGARGTVHLRADVSALKGAGRAVQDTTSRPRR
jgi:hypothetical protein